MASHESSESRRWVLHADMDAFFASIEQRDRPELHGLPVIVGATSARGVVAAASYEARAFGVRSAMPGFEARKLCPHGVYLPANLERYAAVSEQVHAVFQQFTPTIEPIALDEAFLDVTGSVDLFGGPLRLARELKERVRSATGLTVSVGVAGSKLVAKLACTLSKPNGLLVVPAEAVDWMIRPLPVRRLWSVGPVLGATLTSLGIRTIGDLADYPSDKLKLHIGERSLGLQQLARGHDTRPVEHDRDAKSVGEESTFEGDVTERERITATLAAHADAVARRLRRSGVVARTVAIKVKLSRRRARASDGVIAPNRLYPVLTRRRTLAAPTDDGAVLRRAAVELWDAAAVREPVRLLGVTASGLAQRPAEQLDLFGDRQRPLGPVLDAIEARFGKLAISRGTEAPDKVTPTLRRKRGD